MSHPEIPNPVLWKDGPGGNTALSGQNLNIDEQAVIAIDTLLQTKLSIAAANATFQSIAATASLTIGPNADRTRGLGNLTKVGTILDIGTGWEGGIVESPAVWWDPTRQQYGMVYTGYDSPVTHGQIGLAWANSPEGPWVRASGSPLLTYSGTGGAPDQNGCTGPYMRLEGGVYYLFYIGLTATGYEQGTKTLCLATATTINGPWTRYGTIIGLGAGGGWRSGAVYHPTIVKRNGVYYLFFNAFNGTVEQTGYATATSLLGPWTVDDVNSPVVRVGTGGSWDSQIVGDPSVYLVDDMWYMAYFGYDGTHGQDGAAFTTDAAFPLGWTKHISNPLLAYGPSNLDDLYAHKPFIFTTPSRHYHFYTAVRASSRRKIALAVTDGVEARSSYPLPEQASNPTTNSISYVQITVSDVVIDTRDKPGLQVRIVGQAFVASGQTMSVMEAGPLSGTFSTPVTAVVVGAGGYAPFASAWAECDCPAALTSSYLLWKTANNTTAAAMQWLSYEFRWFPR